MAPVHAGIKRRHFLRVLGAAAVAIAAAPLSPAANEFVRPEVVIVEALAFHKDAFASVWVGFAAPHHMVANVTRARFDVLVGWNQDDFRARVLP